MSCQSLKLDNNRFGFADPSSILKRPPGSHNPLARTVRPQLATQQRGYLEWLVLGLSRGSWVVLEQVQIIRNKLKEDMSAGTSTDCSGCGFRSFLGEGWFLTGTLVVRTGVLNQASDRYHPMSRRHAGLLRPTVGCAAALPARPAFSANGVFNQGPRLCIASRGLHSKSIRQSSR